MKKRPASECEGRWRITWMDQWDQDYVDEEVEGYVEFDSQGRGSFQFGYFQGQIDGDATIRDDKPAVEFSWEGGDGADGTPLTGRGWAVLQDEEISGMIFIHQGDQSKFKAQRAKPKRLKRSAQPKKMLGDEPADAVSQELSRVLEGALNKGVPAVSIEYVGRELRVFYRIGNLGVGGERISSDVSQAVMDKLAKCTGPRKNSKGTLSVTIAGKRFVFQLERFDSFGDAAFRVSLRDQPPSGKQRRQR